jgi:hypothetical protein
MATNKSPISRPHRGQLNHWQENVLRYGPEDRWDDAFPDEAAVQEAWAANRERILSSYNWGRRPWAWWAYDSTIPYPRDPDYAEARLYESGQLSEEERAQLVARWREHFDKAQEPGFSYCIGHLRPGDSFATWLEGPAAQRALYKWAGIPRTLLREWKAQHRRRQKVIRRLAASSQADETTSGDMEGAATPK